MQIKVIRKILLSFPAISLKEMEGVWLMNRMDTKYTTTVEKLVELLGCFKGEYFVQEVDGVRSCLYQTLYFDTHTMDMYLAHQNGRKNREKIRIRSYVDSNLSFLEIKDKNNKGRTCKTRIPFNGRCLHPDGKATPFINRYGRYNPAELEPHIENRFYRITLVNQAKTERLTIDTNICFRNLQTGLTENIDELVIIELKQDGNCLSPAKKYLRQLGIHPVSISKYCLGTMLTNHTVKQNRFKSKLIKINKIINHSYGHAY
ncbi:MAG: polyphosphate polymerase domain-containing protein [Tannerellaceae bacterium]|nr:polyphosphate polymerase domain-containing protein [Tannerellaceae bacterium]MCD8264282.1 polyphosphate polymerase domain-containing protein [Tannerellaceae bacterium]